MGKLLKLADGSDYTATISSTITDLHIPVDKYKDVDSLKAKLTPTNLASVVFDGRVYKDLALVDDSASRESGKLNAHIVLELGIEDRIEAEKQAAVDAYTMQLIEEGLL